MHGCEQNSTTKTNCFEKKIELNHFYKAVWFDYFKKLNRAQPYSRRHKNVNFCLFFVIIFFILVWQLEPIEEKDNKKLVKIVWTCAKKATRDAGEGSKLHGF